MFLIAFFSFLLLSGFRLSQEFSYDEDEGNGPSHWGETCIGKHQSPINIEEQNVKNTSMSSLTLKGIDKYNLTMINNGHTVMLKPTCNKFKIELSGGPLRDIYVFEQLHYHWGKNDNEGSEHLIDNHPFSMEMHAVFYKKKYASMDEALKNNDSLTVLAYFFKVGRQENLLYKRIVKKLSKVKKANKTITLRHSLLKILRIPNFAMQKYFTYNGSLTTPPCLEIVTWIIFKDYYQYLSDKQLAAFRDIEDQEGKKLTHNFRPPQPLGDRKVFQNIPKKHCLFEVYG